MLSDLFNPRDVSAMKAIRAETDATCKSLMEQIEKPSFKAILARLDEEEPGETVILATIDKGTLKTDDGRTLSCKCGSVFHNRCKQ